MKSVNKRLLLLAVLAAAVLVIAACAPVAPAPAPTSAPAQPTTGAAPQPTSAPAQPTTAAPAQPTTGATATGRGACGTLKLLWWQAPTILNPHQAQGTKDYDASRLVYLPLAAIGPDGNPDNSVGLAVEVPTRENGGISADGTTTTWKLRPGLKWSDGQPLTADDLIFTWKYVTDKDTASPDAASYQDIKTIDKIDDQTIKITWNQPTATPYVAFVGVYGMILPEHVFKDWMGTKAKDAPANLAPIGAGPFKVKEFKPGDVVTYVANENYFDPNKPCFSDVTLKGGGDATSAARAVFESGDIDYAWNTQVPADVLTGLAAEGKGTLVNVPSANVERLLLQRADVDPSLGDLRGEPPDKGGKPHPFLSDLKVRQALALAVDRDTIANKIYGGEKVAGGPTCNIITAPPAYVSTTKFETCEFNIDNANKLLDEAGWMKGSDGIRHKTVDGKDVKMHIVYQTSVNPVRQAVQQIIKDAWTQLGIDVELKQVDAGVFFSSDAGNPDTAAHFFADVEMFTNNPSQPDDIQYVRGWTCAEIKTKAEGWKGNNYERYCDKDYDALVDQLSKELDPAKRAELYKKINDKLINDVVIIPIVARDFPIAARANSLKGTIPDGWDSDVWNIADWSR